jgi:hypothetical protein
MTRPQSCLTGLATLSRQGRHHARWRCAMRAYLKAVTVIVGLLGTYLALLPLTV